MLPCRQILRIRLVEGKLLPLALDTTMVILQCADSLFQLEDFITQLVDPIDVIVESPCITHRGVGRKSSIKKNNFNTDVGLHAVPQPRTNFSILLNPLSILLAIRFRDNVMQLIFGLAKGLDGG